MYSGVGHPGRACWLTASFKACVCPDGLRPGRNCYPAAARGAGNRLELEARALMLLPMGVEHIRLSSRSRRWATVEPSPTIHKPPNGKLILTLKEASPMTT